MKKSEGKIGSREVFVLVAYMISVELSDMTPTFLFEEGKTATWMMPLIAGIVIIPPFLFLSALLNKYQDKGLVHIVYDLMGKYIGFIINFILFLIMLLATAINSRDYVDIIQTLYLPTTPRIAIYILLMVAVWFIASRGLEVIGRTAWFAFPIHTVVLGIFVILALGRVDLSFLFPFWGSGFLETLKVSVQNSVIVDDILFLPALFPYVRSHKDFKTPALLGLLLCMVEMAGSFAIYIATFDYPSVNQILFPFHQTLSMIQLGRFFINIESVYFAFWVIASVIRYTIYLYLSTAIFAFTLRIKEFEPLLLPMTGLSIMIGMIPGNPVEIIKVFRKNIIIENSWLFLISLPIVLWILFKLRRERKSD
jgi:spore germination protein (amino acid permease)